MAEVGTVDIPERIDRAHYFRELSYLELSLLFDHADAKESTRDRWASIAPKGTVGLVAPKSLSQFKSGADVAALEVLTAMVKALAAPCVVFRSPSLYAPSQANRDQLTAFFAETELGGTERVWIPDGLWEPRSAVKFATEIGVTCAFDPLVREPGSPPEIYDELEAESLYFRVEALGRTGTMSNAQLEDLAALAEQYEGRTVRIVFASRERWRDARNFKKLLAGESD